MRVAFVMGAFPEISTTFILDQVTGLLERGHDVHVFARQPSGDLPVHADYARYKLSERTHHWWASLRAARNVCRQTLHLLREDPRRHGRILLSSLNAFQFGASAAVGRWWSYAATMLSAGHFDVVLAQFGPNGRIALKLRELGAFDAPIATTWLGYDLSRILREKPPDFYRDLLQRGDLMLPLSLHFRERLIALGCPREKILVHPLAVDTKHFSFLPRTLQDGERVRIITICRLVEKKGLEFALRALAKVASAGTSFEYHIVGDGPLRGRIERLRGQLGLENLVTLHGIKTRDEVTSLLAQAHVFLSPSVTASDGDEEGVPTAIKEAMAVGLPVISTVHAAIPELIQDGVSGFLVPEWDVEGLAGRITHVIQSPQLWPAMARAGRETIERDYDLSQLNDRLSVLLEQLAANYRQRRKGYAGKLRA